ncbi:MAG: sugar transferase [Candidatus Actinomarina sp.]|jgi:hypothetical protein|nr:sugar transferase [Actinomycetota bacterium]MBL6833428.1 sugar transferase [Candidatus Actinomarina sp.]MBL6837154.1 sugar transferase [Candidatus Actinomarina sp.]
MRDIMRSLLSANLTITGIIMFVGSLVVFFGSTLLINATNLGKRLAFLVVGAGTFGWGIINSILFVLYAPRGPKPAEIEGLNAFEIRILPLTFLVGSTILFVMFVLALNRYEQEKTESENATE